MARSLFVKITSAFFLAMTALLFSCSALYAAEPLVINPSLKELHLGTYLDILEDKEKKWEVKDVLKGDVAKLFEPCSKKNPSFGYTSSAYWVRFRVLNKETAPAKWCLELTYPLIDSIQLYAVDRWGRVVDKRVAGDMRPFIKREMQYFNFIFKFEEPPFSEKTYIARFETRGSMNLHLVYWSSETFIDSALQIEIANGIFYGAMIVMLLYNLFIFFSVKDISYLYYTLYLLSFAVFQIAVNGLGFQYLWPRWTWWQNNSVPFLILITNIFSLQFSRHFLHIYEHLPRFDRILKGFLYICILLLPFSLILGYAHMVYASIGVAVIFAVSFTAASVMILAKGYRPARFYVIAWTVYWTGTIIYSLWTFAVLPDNIFTRWVMQYATFLVVTLLSLGLADRINIMKKDLEHLNINLENIVVERTRDLSDAIREMKLKDEEIQIEFELAGNIQQGILPRTPFYFEGVKIVSFYRSMGKVGGDFFDFFHMKGGYLGILIADASGHGMPAAFITALAKISFNEAIQRYLFPADIFKMVNDELVETIKTDDFVTAFLMVISPNFDVTYGNASHQMALVMRYEDKSISEWDTNGLFMGALTAANKMYEDKQDVLYYGDRVLLYTDGITESKSKDGINFGEKFLKEAFLESASLPIENARDLIMDRWSEFTKGTSQFDDVTLLIVEIDPAYRDLVEFRENGFTFLWKKRYDEAIAELSKALAINPRDEKTHLYLGECYLKMGDNSKSVEHLMHFLKNNEVDANVWHHLSQAYYNLKNYEMSLKTSEKASHLRNNFIDAMTISGLSHKNLGQKEDAVRLFVKVLMLDSENATAIRELQDFDEAVKGS